MSFSIMFWNVQGADSKYFRQAFRTLIRSFNPAMVVLLEPRISGSKADAFIKFCGFERSHRVGAEGFAGGIWLLWNSLYDVHIVWNHKQYIHFQVSENNSFISWITAVYASPIPTVRKQLWSHLEEIANRTQGPWLVGGDFNTILYASEKKGGVNRSNGVCSLFKNWFHSNKIYELDFKGRRFTWSRGNLDKRLDRAVCNGEWVTRYAGNAVLHLPKIASDHRPVLVRFSEPEASSKANKPFRFLILISLVNK